MVLETVLETVLEMMEDWVAVEMVEVGWVCWVWGFGGIGYSGQWKR